MGPITFAGIISMWQRKRLGSAPFAAVWLAVLMLFALTALACVLIWQNYRAALEAGEARAMSSAQVVAANLRWMMEASDQALQRIDTALGNEPVSNSPAGAIWDIREAVGNLPAGFQYSVYDETGNLRFSSVPEAVGIEVSDREYFRQLRDGAAMVISPQLKERLSGQQVFVVARRIGRNGRFHGAASIAIPTSAMDEFWSLLELGQDSTVSVVRRDGWLVARHPQLSETMDLSQTPLFTRHIPERRNGVYHSAASPADGLSRIVGYREVDGWPLVATTGVETGEALSAFWRSLRAGLIVGLPLIGLLVLGILWIVRLLKADEMRRLALEQALEHNKFLFREIHHRVKNNLQVVSSLVQLQQLPPASKEAIARRIAAMVAVHEQVYGTDQFDEIDVAPYAQRLIDEVGKGFPGEIETHLESFKVPPDLALPLGLVLTEAVSNVFKHAFADLRDGRLVVLLSRKGDDASLIISDNGRGYPSTIKRGMGSRLIEGFVAQLDGELRIENDNGTRITIEFPIV